MTKPDPSVPATAHPTTRPERRGPAPTGTLVVIGILLLSISTLWLLVLGILQGRA